jgi:hypothetical protein
MVRYAKVGYDRLKLNSKEEIELMYFEEGHSMSASKVMAATLHTALEQMIKAEKRKWKEIRENEIPFGLLEEPEGG